MLTENRNGLVVDVRLTQATGAAERDAALDMLRGKPALKRVTLGADRGYDAASFVRQLRELKVTPHVAQNDSHRRSAIDVRTTRHGGYPVSQRKQKRVEEVFGWMKTVALQRKTRFLGPERTGWMFTLAAATYNLVRMLKSSGCKRIGRSVSGRSKLAFRYGVKAAQMPLNHSNGAESDTRRHKPRRHNLLFSTLLEPLG